MHSAAAVISLVQAMGSPITDTIGRRYTAVSPARAFFRPLMNFIVMKIMRKGDFSGKCAMRNGAAARLNLSDIHIISETAVSMNAWQVRKSSLALWAVENSEKAVIPKKAAGASVISDTAFDMIESPRLFRKYFRLMSILESGVSDFRLLQSSVRR